MPEGKEVLSVLVVDDKPEECKPLRTMLSDPTSPFTIDRWDTITNDDQAVANLATDNYNLVILDLNFGEGKAAAGVKVLETIRRTPTVAHHAVVVFTGYPGAGHQEETLSRGVDGFLIKARKGELGDAIRERLPAVVHVVRKALRMSTLRKDYCTPQGITLDPKEKTIHLLGMSPEMQELFSQVVRVAADMTRPNVLILGETGTGKSKVARVVQAVGLRRDKAFRETVLNTFSKELLESELFGHIKGAFTGAVADRKGVFEEAQGGTVFLDEIGEIPLDVQVKLLRVLRERKVRRVGGDTDIDVDFQLITATLQDLELLVREGRFRADLYHRLRGVTLRIPTLRERFASRPLELDEIIAFQMDCWASAEEESDRRFTFSFTNDAMNLLRAHTWPGNYAEFQTLLQELSLLSCSKVDYGMVAKRLLKPESFLALAQRKDPLGYVYEIDNYRQATEKFQDEYIEYWLNQCDGNAQKTAERLGIDAATVYRRKKPRDAADGGGKKAER